MPWTEKNYPTLMRFLPAVVRTKAIEIGNALMAERSMSEGVVIGTAITRAKDWAANLGLSSRIEVRLK